MTTTIGKMGGGVLLALVLGAGPATAPATRPAFTQDAADLGAADPALRQAATQRLWWAGEPAEPALRDAQASPNPEAAARARVLLRNIDLGFAPSTSPTVMNLREQYRVSSNYDRQRVVGALQGCGIDGARVLVQLWEHEPNDRMRDRIQRALAASPRLAAVLLLSEGERSEAETLLAQSSQIGFPSAREFVAYWQVRPDSPEKTVALRQATINHIWWTEALLDNAAGDDAAARRDALTSGPGELSYGLAAQSGNWTELEREVLSAIRSKGQLHDYQLRAVAANLASDSATVGKQLPDILTATAGPGMGTEPWRRAVALCLSDRPADAVKVLVAAGDFVNAADLLEPQMQYAEELSLLDRAKNDPVQTARLQARAATLLYSLGKRGAAAEMLREATGANRQLNDSETAGLLCQAARRMDRPDEADELLLEAITRNATDEVRLFQKDGFPDPVDAGWWWHFQVSRQSSAAALHAVRALADGHVPAGELAHLADEFENWSVSQPASDQPAILHAQASAWLWAGRPDKQLAVLKRLADASPAIASYMALGDCAEQQQDWPTAADAYGNAARLDPANAPAVFLHGWALTHVGDADGGQQLMELAHELPLGDAGMRTELFLAAQKRGLAADADRERDALLATGNFCDPGMIHFLQVMTSDAMDNKDFALAQRYFEQAMWAEAYSGAPFADASAYVRIPAQLHRIRAMALFAAHQPDAALAEAKICLANDPGSGAGLIDIVRAADAAGATAQGDELFNAAIAQNAKLLQDFPNSPSLHNQIAWEEARCRRKLDDALGHAQRAADLAPDDCAILDTLAETHYQRKEFQSAIDTINRCITLEPSEPHHRKQLARFELGLKTGQVDDE